MNGEQGTLRQKTIRSVSWVGLTNVITNILFLVKGIILARLLMPEAFGIMSICLIIVRALEIFSETGFYAALIHRQGDIEEAKNTAFTLMVVRGFILAAITMAISPLAASYYEKDILDTLIKVLALSFIFGGFYNVNMVSLQKDLSYRILSYNEQIQAVLNFVVVVVLAYLFRSVWALVLGHLFAAFLGLVLSFILIPGRPRLMFNRKIAREIFSYGKFITGLTIVAFITVEANNLVIGKLLGMQELGYYVIAYTLANVPATHISKVLSRVLFPAFSRIQNDKEALSAAYIKCLKLVSSLVIPISAGLAVLAPEILQVVYGEIWLPAAYPLIILCLCGCVRALSAIQGYLYVAIGKPNVSFYLNIAKLLLLLAAIIPLTGRYGLAGASWALTIPFMLQFVVEPFILRRMIGIRVRAILNILGVSAISSAIMCVAVILLKNAFLHVSGVELFILVSSGAMFYFLANHKQILSNYYEIRTSFGTLTT